MKSEVKVPGQHVAKHKHSDDSSYVSHQRFIVYVNKGDHGYHNSEMDMKTIFRAFGPDFKKNFLSEPFDSIHIYPLMCKLLKINPAPHNGSLSVTENLLLHNGESIICSEFLSLRVVVSSLFFSVLKWFYFKNCLCNIIVQKLKKDWRIRTYFLLLSSSINHVTTPQLYLGTL